MNTKNILLFGSALLFNYFSSAQTVPTPDHVVIVIEENHAYETIFGDVTDAPYINALADSGALFTQSFALTHPSQPNYLMFYSGSDQGINGANLALYGDVYPSSSPWNLTLPFTTKNLGACLIAGGKTFTGYAEGLPSVGFTGATSGNYASKHAPYTYWQGTGANNIPSADNQPFTSFPANFSNLPTVSYVIPNLNDDMHNGNDPATIVTGDTWLKNKMDAYIQWAKTHNSLFILTWDEDDDVHNNHIVTLFAGQMVKKGQYSEQVNHYRVLRTVEDMYGICHDANDSTLAPITDCWQTATGMNEDAEVSNTIHVSPNPSNGIFTVQSADPSASLRVTSVEILNVLGEKVYEVNSDKRIATSGNNPNGLSLITIDLSSQPQGVYFMQLKTEHGNVVKKLVISR